MRRWHIVCRTCATDLHETGSERPHEVVTGPGTLAVLFRASHYGHDVHEAEL